MKQGWEKIPFEDSIVKVKYTTKIPSNDYLEQGVYPIVSQEEGLISGYWNNEEDVFKISSPVVIFGDHTRILKYVDFDFVLGADGVKILQPINGINAKFFKLYLQSCKIQSLGYSRHYKLLKELQVPIPSLEEQERIVAELDCLSGIIEKKREQLKELDALAESIFYTMFGDPSQSEYKVRRLVELSNAKLSYGSGASAIVYDGETRYVRITDIKEDGELNNDKASPSVIDDKYLLNEGDILFARSGATVGKTYHYKEKDGRAIYAGYLIRFIPNTQVVLPSYIFRYTKTEYYRAFIQSSAQAVAQPNINAQQYGSLMVPVPPLTLQQEFADKIEAIEKQKELIKQSITETEELFNSRMDYYFN